MSRGKILKYHVACTKLSRATAYAQKFIDEGYEPYGEPATRNGNNGLVWIQIFVKREEE